MRKLALGCALLTVSGCQELRVRLQEWAAPPSAHASSNVAPAAAPERFLVLNVAQEDSHWTQTAVVAGSERPGAHRTDHVSSPSAASGQLVINPEDLSRISGVVAGRGMEFRLGKVSVSGPNTLASLAAPGKRTQLAVSGQLEYGNVSRPADVTLLVEADITEGQLNSLRLATASPLRVLAAETAERAPTTVVSPGASSAGPMSQTAASPATSGAVSEVGFELVARPSASEARVPSPK